MRRGIKKKRAIKKFPYGSVSLKTNQWPEDARGLSGSREVDSFKKFYFESVLVNSSNTLNIVWDVCLNFFWYENHIKITERC